MPRRSLLVAVVLLAAVVVPPAHGAGVRIYPLGDSITYGTASAGSLPTPGGYRGVLDRLLDQAGIAHEFVGTAPGHHDGHPGYRIDQDAAGLDSRAGAGDGGGSWLTGRGARLPIFPDVTVIHLGTNDISQRYDPARTFPTTTGRANLADPAQRATFVADLTARLAALVDKIEQVRPRSRIVLSTIVPMDVASLDVTAAEYATAVTDLTARERAESVRIVVADAWTAFTVAGPAGRVVVPGLLGPDGVHPDEAGYAVLAAVYRDAIAAALALP